MNQATSVALSTIAGVGGGGIKKARGDPGLSVCFEDMSED